MTIKFKFLSILLISLIAMTGYSQTRPNNFDYGHVKDNKYVNSFFNCELTIPTDWIVQSKEQIETISKKGKELITGDVFIIYPYEIANPIFLEDCEMMIVKTPSNTKDKFVI